MPMDGLAMQRSDALDVASFKGSPESPDGTPPSNSLAEEAYRSAYATPTYRPEPRRKWLGTHWLPDARKQSQRRKCAELSPEDSAGRDDFTDIVGLMESGWCVSRPCNSQCHISLEDFLSVTYEVVLAFLRSVRPSLPGAHFLLSRLSVLTRRTEGLDWSSLGVLTSYKDMQIIEKGVHRAN